MFRCLLILVLILQTGTARSRGDCRAPQGAQPTCCQVSGPRTHQSSTPTCCRRHSEDDPKAHPSNSEQGGLHQPCCGCCHVAPIALLANQSPTREPELQVDFQSLVDESMIGLSLLPSTPPPNLLV